jgi:two-component system invasion response regulator UvrY
MKNKKVILVDSSSFLRKALKNTLLSIGNVDIVAEATSDQEFLSLLETITPDIVFIDTKTSTIDGIEATRIASKKYPKLMIIAFSSNDKQCYIEQMIGAGAKGYLSKCKNNYDILSKIIKNPEKATYYSLDK